MNKLLLIVLLLSSCTYQPWRHEEYMPIRSDESKNYYSEKGNFLLKVSILSTRIDDEIRKTPYELYLKYVDHTMEYEAVEICSLKLITSLGRVMHDSGNKCIVRQLVVPSLSSDIKPYATGMAYSIENLDLDFNKGEMLTVMFDYSVLPKTDTNRKKISVIFIPVLDTGKFKPCCLPSV